MILMYRVPAFLALVMCICLMSGCWDRRELNDLAVASALGIDKSKNGYLLTAQVINPSEVAPLASSGRKTTVTILRASGETIFEALRKLTRQSSRKLYLSHLRVIVFSERVAKEGLRKPLDFLSRDHEMRTDLYILIARGTRAENILKTLDPQENIPTNAMFLSLETSEKSFAATVVKEIEDLITDIVSNGKDPAITGIKMTGRQEQGMSMEENLKKVDAPVRLNLNGTAVFRDDKLVGWLNDSETKGYNYATGRVENTVGNIACPNHQGNMAIEVLRTDAKIKGKVKNGRPTVDIYIEAEANIGEIECDIDLMSQSTFTKLERMLDKQNKKLIGMAVEKAKEFRSDIFGFGDAIHRSDPKGWAQVKHRWHDRFPDTKVNVHVNFKLQRTGTITESFQKENVE